MPFLNEKTPEHWCDFPDDPADFPVDGVPAPFWLCPECGAEYRLGVSLWTGWWSYCSDTGKITRRPGASYDTIICHEEEWVDCSPNLTYTVVKKGLFGFSTTSSGMSMSHPNPSPKPEWMTIPRGTRRPIIKKEAPQDENVRSGWLRPRRNSGR